MSTNNDINDIMDAGEFKNYTSENPIQRIKVIGVGGGGNNAVIHMHKKGIKDVSFVLINTDRQVLDSAAVPTKLLIGPGLGAGGNPERARKYAEENSQQIADLFDDETDMVFITAGMGGGTGTGAAPVVARIAKELGILTVGIVTLPFMFEGPKKVTKALEGANEMAKYVDSLLVINNERLTDIYKNLDILNAFAKADDTLLNAAQSITDIITIKGIINRDFNDVDTTLRDGGTAIISTGYGEGPDRVTAAIQDALHSPLLRNTDIFGSKKLLMILYVSDDPENHPFPTEETEALREFVAGIDREVDVMWGLYPLPGLDDKVRMTILASGFEVSNDEFGFTPVESVTAATTDKAKKSPANNDKKAKSPEGPSLPPIKNGHVLDPEHYDDSDEDALKDFESTPAIARSPFRRRISGITGSNFRGNGNSRGNVAKNNNSDPSSADKDGGVTLSFDDI